jgi:hypothetical protein
MAGGLLVGRPLVRLDAKAVVGGHDELYSAQLLDGAKVVRQTFKHCTFSNISFKDVYLDQCTFVNCAFVDCYFRGTIIQRTQLRACKFEDCNFSSPTFIDSTFAFLEFRGCFIPFDVFGKALPTDAGLRHRIADELAREAAVAGSLRDAREYHLAGEDAYEDHIWNIAWASGGAYYAKSRSILVRIKHGLEWIGRKFNRHLWGYGERGWVLARSFAVVGGLIFPAIFVLFERDNLRRAGHPLGVLDYELLSFDNLLNAPALSGVDAGGSFARWIIGGEVLVGLMFIGLFISLVSNWMRRR